MVETTNGTTKREPRLEQYSDEEFYLLAPTERDAHDLAVATIHPEGLSCPDCYGKDVTAVGDGIPVDHRCNLCKRTFNVLSNTVLDGLEIPFQEIMWAAFVFTSLTMFSSPKELAGRMGWDEATATEVFLRFLMAADRPRPKLLGIAEFDWTWVPCVDRHGGSQKILVIGLVARPSNQVKALEILPDEKQGSVSDFILRNYAGGRLYGDSHASNRSLRDFVAEHAGDPNVARIVMELCNHSEERFVEGPASTNLVEGFWSTMKPFLYREYDWLGDHSLTHCLNGFLWWDGVRKESHRKRINDLMQGCRSKRPKRICDEYDFELHRKIERMQFDMRNLYKTGSGG